MRNFVTYLSHEMKTKEKICIIVPLNLSSHTELMAYTYFIYLMLTYVTWTYLQMINLGPKIKKKVS